MDCVNIVKMSVKELRKAVKTKYPKARVSTMNKIQLSSMLLGIKPKIPPPLKKPKIPPPLKAPPLPPKNTISFNKALTSVRKSRTLKELKTKVVNLKETKVVKRISKEDKAIKQRNKESKAIRNRVIKETKIFNKAIDKNLVFKKKTLSELKQKAPKYIQEKARQATIRKNTPITQSNIKTGLSNLKKNDNNDKFKSMLRPGIKNNSKNVKCENYIINNIYPHIDKKILNNPANQKRIEDIIMDHYDVINDICEFVNGIKERELKTTLSIARDSLIKWNKANYKKNGKLKKQGERNISELRSIENHINNLEKQINQVQNVDYTKDFMSIYDFFDKEYGIINEINNITQTNIKPVLSNNEIKKNDTSSLQPKATKNKINNPTKVIQKTPKAPKNKIKNPSELLAKLTKEYKILYEKWKENKEKNGYDGKFLSPKFCNNASMNVRFSDNCDTIINQLFRIWINGKNETTTIKSIKHLEIMISLIKVEIKRNNGKVSYEDLSPASIINN